jgi:flavin-dependent dehydrogenase
MSTDERVEVAIIGGGPAGCATAIALARAGRTVVVLERSDYGTERVGETLPPRARLLLGELGVWERFQADDHAPSPGIISVWGSREPYENDFIVNPYGHGWHIDRRRFDQMLGRAAEEAGARVCRSARVTTCLPGSCGGWQVNAVAAGRGIRFQAEFLVEATGRSAPPVLRATGTRNVYDRLVGVVTFLEMNGSATGRDRRTLVEASENGWWYSALLPQDRLVAAYMTDADQFERRQLPEVWQQCLHQAPHTKARIQSCVGRSRLRIVSANSYYRNSIAGRDRLAVGDTAAAYDPLSAQGLYKALESGLTAARAILECRRGRPGALDQYAGGVIEGFAAYLRTRAEYYGRERRWPESVFWLRRQSQQK